MNKYKLLVVVPPETYTPLSNEGVKWHTISRAVEEAEAVIRSTGHPVLITELYQAVLDRGMELGGKSPASSLSTGLFKNQRLKFIPKVGWWLRGVSWPPKPDEIGLIHSPPPEDAQQTGSRRRRRTPEKERLYQELRRFLEGKAEPTHFRDIYDHIKKLGLPIGGKDEKQNLSAFMTSIHEFRTHGLEGRGGWTFVPDSEWSVADGFKQESKPAKWLNSPMRKRLFEAIRDVLKAQSVPLPSYDIFPKVKALGVQIGNPGADEAQYFKSYMATVPCFIGNRQGYRYVPELDETKDSLEDSSDADLQLELGSS